MTTTVTKTIDVALTPKELAHLFWSMDYDAQAEFFSELSKEAGSYKLQMQMYYVADHADYDARDSMSAMGYAHRRVDSYV